MIAAERRDCVDARSASNRLAAAIIESELAAVGALPASIRALLTPAGAGASGDDRRWGGDVELELISNRLGTAAAGAAALARFVDAVFFGGDPKRHGPISRVMFWRQAIDVAVAAELIAAERAPAPDKSDVLVAGLLHEIGKAALQHFVPKSFARLVGEADRSGEEIQRVERRRLGVDHAWVGERLARGWRLPEGVCLAIAGHHDAAMRGFDDDPVDELTTVVQLADALVHMVRDRRPSPGVRERTMTLGRRLGLTPDLMEGVRSRISGRAEKFLAAMGPLLGIGGSEGAEVWGATAVGAPHRSGARRGDRARPWLRAWAGLVEEWPWVDGVVSAIRSIAQCASGLFETEHLAVFAVDAANDTCHAWMIRGGSGVATSFLMESEIEASGEAPLGPSPIGGGWEAPTGAAAEVRNRFRRAFHRDLRRWMRLIHGGRCVGGVLVDSMGDAGGAWAEDGEIIAAVQVSFGQIVGQALAEEERRRERDRWRSGSEDQADEFERAVRLAATGMVARLGGGAAHELNTPLSVISGRAQMLRVRTADAEIQNGLEAIQDQAQKCSRIVGDLIAYAKPGESKPTLMVLKPWLEALARQWVERGASSHAAVSVQWPAPTLTAWADGEQMTRVFDAILANAVEASDPRNVRVVINSCSIATDEMVVVTVEDHGCGMAAEVLGHACDPFYSHRTAGRG
ncbi:MAG: HDOD domain-containing protein, partial [Phycisphaerales bacterium]|nr:HDOD domain-containing protein [Phycisphaerales bacterium]